ncbi:ABC transporter permease [Fulvivirgaceae bacterium BMA10]|uniref:ABC transporter permease n=1 Tax=Splendidivirga corallicola TaxID=3051826 RepID=A0ABT8KJW6_9BACT|nr:ABC transporter permease [Fulvivirgaceae bacterium BMA10]
MKPSPPHRALKFLRWFCQEDYIEEIEGDLTEVFEKQYEQSQTKARRKFTWSVIRYFRPEFIKSFKSSSNPNTIAMFRHNFLLTFRNFKRYKSSFFINLVGLSTGLACSLLIYLWVADELRMDKFHKDDSQIFQVLENFDEATGLRTGETTSGYMAESLAADMPEVEYSVAVLTYPERKTLSVEDKNLKASGRYVGKDFFKIFSFPIVQGNPDKIWLNKNTILVSEALALKLFNTTENIIGRTIKFQHDQEFFVSGIFSTIPSNSSQQFDFLLSFEEFVADRQNYLDWGNTPANAYVKLKSGVNVDDFNGKIADYVQIKRNKKVRYRTPFLARYSDRYLYGKYENGIQSGGRIEYVKLFSIIALFILGIACINFMNLSTAKASRRTREVGIKKTIGASRKSLIHYYLGESTLMAFLSALAAVGLVLLLLPQFNEITGKHLVLNPDIELILSLLGVVLLTGLVSGSYPALYLSGFNPVVILKGKLSNAMGEVWARKGLVILQFSISVILIVSVLVVYKQIEFVQSKNLGFTKDNVIFFDREGKLEEEEHIEAFLHEVENLPGVLSASVTSHGLSGADWGVYGFEWEGKDPNDNTHFEHMTVYFDVMEILEMELRSGRTFSKDFGSEFTKVIFNEAAIEHMALKDPIGEKIKFWGMDKEIIGVVKNFHFESLHESIRPLMISFWPSKTKRFIVKIEGGKEKEVIDGLQKFYRGYNPGFALDYKFLDSEYQLQYVAEQRVATLSHYFAGLAILISCLGLFGLATFTAERRIKEIGIRKILGSSIWGIVRLLSGDFGKMVMAAVAIALPISYFIVAKWLESFAYRIDLKWWFFIGAGVMALFIAWLTVGIQTIKAARINPTECLKDE